MSNEKLNQVLQRQQSQMVDRDEIRKEDDIIQLVGFVV